jgi:hypothetical protein
MDVYYRMPEKPNLFAPANLVDLVLVSNRGTFKYNRRFLGYTDARHHLFRYRERAHACIYALLYSFKDKELSERSGRQCFVHIKRSKVCPEN